MAYDLRVKEQQRRYYRALSKRRDRFFPFSEKIVQNAFHQMQQPVMSAVPKGIEEVNKAVDSFEPLMRLMLRRIWETAGGSAYTFATENFGGHDQKANAWLAWVANFMSGKTGDKIKGISDETKDMLKRAIFSGAEEGETMDKTTARVKDCFGDDMETWRAQRIARSETVDAFNQATIQQGKDAGSHLDFVWINTDDDKVRTAHMDAPRGVGGTQIPYDQDDGFDVADGTSWPGEAVNCRCCIGYAPPELAAAGEPSAIDYQNFVQCDAATQKDVAETAEAFQKETGIEIESINFDDKMEYAASGGNKKIHIGHPDRPGWDGFWNFTDIDTDERENVYSNSCDHFIKEDTTKDCILHECSHLYSQQQPQDFRDEWDGVYSGLSSKEQAGISVYSETDYKGSKFEKPYGDHAEGFAESNAIWAGGHGEILPKSVQKFMAKRKLPTDIVKLALR
jgi:SPP1 gp7 family putative phage head morphogenesis protein